METVPVLEDTFMEQDAVIEEALPVQAFKEQAKIVDIKRKRPS